MANPERLEQFKICVHLDEEYPDALYTSSIAGLKLPKHLGAQLSQAGYRRGTSDLMIFEARHGYHALFLEVKTLTGKPSDDQLEFQQLSRDRGYKYEFCYGREEGIKIIDEYLGGVA